MKLICSDCSDENFATNGRFNHANKHCDFCGKKTICQEIKVNQ